MSARNNFVRLPLAISKFTCFLVFLSFFVITCLSSFTMSQECSAINDSSDCKCIFPNRSIIDISSLGLHNHVPRWLDEIPTNKSDLFRYSYNPCYRFNLGSAGTCQNVAVCRRRENNEYNCGEMPRFVWNATRGILQIIYTVQISETTVNLVCSPETWQPQLKVKGEISPNHYEMTLTSRCACSDLCRESHLSTGSVLVILLMIFTALYLVLGIIHSSLTRGAHGWELIPHYEFWADFPLLVRDGCVFVVSGCKADTAYERI